MLMFSLSASPMFRTLVSSRASPSAEALAGLRPKRSRGPACENGLRGLGTRGPADQSLFNLKFTPAFFPCAAVSFFAAESGEAAKLSPLGNSSRSR